MISPTTRRISGGLLLLGAATLFAAPVPASAQPSRLPPGAVVQPLEDQGAGAELRRNLTTLAQNPQSLTALIGAGRAALDMGDVEAGLSFFSRADEIAPRDPRVKAGMASALVRLERGETALLLFAEAVQLGAPEAEIAADRGLAYDMVGDPRSAQRDYAMALRRDDNPEVRRRMALSLAISGQRDAALRMIDGQLRAHDRAAWRTQAFVLALTGDAAGANRTAAQVMPANAAQAMAPFLSRMASLSPAQQAAAVHFGRFPADGLAMASAAPVDTRADPGALALAQGDVPPAPAARRSRTPAPVSTAPRRRPDVEPSPTQNAAVGFRGERRSLIDSSRRTAEAAGRVADWQTSPQRETATPRPVELTQAEPRRFEPPPAEPVRQPIPSSDPVEREPDPAPPPRAASPFGPPTPPRPEPSPQGEAPAFSNPGFTLMPQGAQPVVVRPAPAPSGASSLDQIAAVIAEIPAEVAPPPRLSATPAPAREEPPAPAPTTRQQRDAAARAAEARNRAANRTRTAEARPAPTERRPRAAARPVAPANPSRHWVQIAGGANRTTMPREYARLRGLAPALLGSRPGWVTAANATNRLLVGPFENARAAQAFVNQLAQRDLSAFVWTSAAGQEIERLSSGR
jgi:Flp pilus assembly protein TadD